MMCSRLLFGSHMLKPILTCCKLYISESRNALALESIERAARLYPEAVIVNRFKDEAYNRVGYTLVAGTSSSVDTSPLGKPVFSMVKAALEAIDLELHSGTHPRLGVVDHICFHPLAQASLEQVAGIARSVAADIGNKLQGVSCFTLRKWLVSFTVFFVMLFGGLHEI